MAVDGLFRSFSPAKYPDAYSLLDQPALPLEDFFRQWQDGRWMDVKRCC